MYVRSLGDIIKKTDALFIYSLSLFTHYLLIPHLFSYLFTLFIHCFMMTKPSFTTK